MSYPTLVEDIKWLSFSAEVKAKLEPRMTGSIDVVRIAAGQLLAVINTPALNEVTCWFTPLRRATELGVDGVVEHFYKYAREQGNTP